MTFYEMKVYNYQGFSFRLRDNKRRTRNDIFFSYENERNGFCTIWLSYSRVSLLAAAVVVLNNRTRVFNHK